MTADPPTATDSCPVCLQPAAIEHLGDELLAVTCRRCGGYRVSPQYAVALRDREDDGEEVVDEKDVLVSAYLREMTLAGRSDVVLTPESTRLMIDAAPRTIGERLDRLLLNLSKVDPRLGRFIEIGPDDFVLGWCRHGGELNYLVSHLIEEGLLSRDPGTFAIAEITVAGWRRIEQIGASTTSLTQAFVAMTFDDELASAYDLAIGPAIRDAGYTPLILSRIEDADQVDDRIILELNRSRFVVADFTQHRPSVYFEAGYALGRGLPVIWTCRADDYDEAHFDTRQYNHIVWRTEDELRERLYNRIKVLVG